MSDKDYQHTPVLLKESIELLDLDNGNTFVDCNLGGGGHTKKIKFIKPAAKIYGIDMDQAAITAAKGRLSQYDNIEYLQDNFINIAQLVPEKVDGILFDLGISSYQIDEASRGFSLRQDGPLDMRMDPGQKLTAGDIINQFSQDELTKIFREFGEEKFSHRIAKAIISRRANGTIDTTFQLKEIVSKAIPTWKKRESVTRIFQALRIAVNNELDSLKKALLDAIELLKPNGRLVAIAYHSLEDRIVKHTLRQAKSENKLTVLTKRPVLASAEEIETNPRARSAKLRAAEKL